ncbi:uncharacterized protein LOC110457798 [Mizuhopecten yessoensis]|uniref:uncharacterized protein LOC110457798 n=1 Tax=Mizuhopecten yessoensis TaxID=6573 RepID=UPI000B45E54B|nr:uncharacterized protein LOC110457798 [Mizuhopecten yessoensis]
MNSMKLSNLVIVPFLLEYLLVNAATLCNFVGETVPKVQPDGLTKCVCDTSRHYCGQREDACSFVQCDGNKILLQSCGCVCAPNYVESINGMCIPVPPPRDPVRCEGGEVVLPNGQCGLPPTTEVVTTTTTSPPVQPNPPEVNASHITSTYVILDVKVESLDGSISSGTIAVWLYKPLNESLLRYLEHNIETKGNSTEIRLPDLTPSTTYKVEVRTILYEAKASDARILAIHTKAGGNEMLTVSQPNSSKPLYIYIGVPILVALVVCLPIIIIGLVLRRRGSNCGIATPSHDGLPAPVASTNERDRDAERGNELDAVVFGRRGSNSGTTTLSRDDSNNQNNDSLHIYPRLSQQDQITARDVKGPDETRPLKRDFESQSNGTESDSKDPDETKPLKPHLDLRSSGRRYGGNGKSREMDILGKSLISNFSSSTVDEETYPLKVGRETAVDGSYTPYDITCSRSYEGLLNRDQSHNGEMINQPNTEDYNCRQVLSNQCDSRSIPQDAIRRERRLYHASYNRSTQQIEYPQSINSLQRPGATQPTSNTIR